MAESFSNSLTRAAGIVTSWSGSSVAAASTAITVTANTGIGVSQLVDNTNYIAGTKVKQIAGTTIYTDKASTNAATPPFFWTSAIACSVNVVFPELSGP